MCTHTTWVASWWEEVEDDWTGESETVFHDGYDKDTIEDIDTHRMKCTQCGKIFYYSGKAEAYYEGNGSGDGLFIGGKE